MNDGSGRAADDSVGGARPPPAAADERQRTRRASAAAELAATVAATLDDVIVPGIALVAAALDAEGLTVRHVRRPTERVRPDGALVSIGITPMLTRDDHPEMVASAIADAYVNALQALPEPPDRD